MIPVLVGVGFLSALCELIDTSLGGGYGTILSPILILMGFPPIQAVPSVLAGQIMGGLFGGTTHHIVGNINLDFKPDKEATKKMKGWGYVPRSKDSKVVACLAVLGVFGAVIGAITALNIPTVAVKTYIGVMVFGIGVLIVLNKTLAFSWKGILGLGLVSAFNKGISGGGYGPLVTGGQLVVGRESRESVGTTTVSEVVVCLVGFSTYLIATGKIPFPLALATVAGAMVGGPVGALFAKKVPKNRLKLLIGIITVCLGIGVLLNLKG